MPRTVVIDTCCTLNLLATRRGVEIASSLDLRLLDTPYVSREPMTLWTPPDHDGVRTREPTSTGSLRQGGHLQTQALDTDALVDAAARIKDADASCIALAGVLRLPLLTDDRKERSLARHMFHGIELVSTLDIVEEAARTIGWTREELVRVASDLRWRGNFAPPKGDPLGAWYEKLLTGA